MKGFSSFLDISFFMFSPISLAIFSFPETFRCSPWHLKSFLLKFACIIFALSAVFTTLCSFLLNTSISLFTHDVSCRSYLVGAVTIMMFVFCLFFTNFPKYLRPTLASFLLTSLAPPITITVSLFPTVLISPSAKFVTSSSLAPDITVPVNSKSFPRPLDISAA